MKILFTDGSSEQYEDQSLAGGAQGNIYRSRDQRSVVKIDTFAQTDQAELARERQRRRAQLAMLIEEFNPTRVNRYWSNFFAWPEKNIEQVEFARKGREACTGYRMPYIPGLREASFYIVLNAYQTLKTEEKGWFIGRVAGALKIALAAEQLARMGLCYADFSERNVLLDTFSGRAVLIDCDSLIVPGRLPALVQGTHRYRAPEIVTGQATPSVETDRHALAVIFYSLLTLAHPLFTQSYCRCETNDAEHTLCLGQRPLYIEHPTDHSNRPQNQPLTSQYLGKEMYLLFQRAFVDGLHNPQRRPLAREWVEALSHVYDRTIPCASPACSWRFFVAQPDAPLACPACSHQLESPPELPFIYLLPARQQNYLSFWVELPSAHYLVAWPERVLHHWHVKAQTVSVWNTPGYIPDTAPCASFHWDHQSNRWYLKNINLPDLTYCSSITQLNTWSSCPVQAALPLMDGMLIQFSAARDAYCAYVTMRKVE